MNIPTADELVDRPYEFGDFEAIKSVIRERISALPPEALNERFHLSMMILLCWRARGVSPDPEKRPDFATYVSHFLTSCNPKSMEFLFGKGVYELLVDQFGLVDKSYIQPGTSTWSPPKRGRGRPRKTEVLR